MIYIDPPYNTGHDFIYNDSFAEDTASYLERSNQSDAQGNRMIDLPPFAIPLISWKSGLRLI